MFQRLFLAFIAFSVCACSEEECDLFIPDKTPCSSNFNCTMGCECENGQTINAGSCEIACDSNNNCVTDGTCKPTAEVCKAACEQFHSTWNERACFVGMNYSKQNTAQHGGSSSGNSNGNSSGNESQGSGNQNGGEEDEPVIGDLD